MMTLIILAFLVVGILIPVLQHDHACEVEAERQRLIAKALKERVAAATSRPDPTVPPDSDPTPPTSPAPKRTRRSASAPQPLATARSVPADVPTYSNTKYAPVASMRDIEDELYGLSDADYDTSDLYDR